MRRALLVFLPAALAAQNPRATIDAGMLEGRVDTSGVLLFQGIPYAAPPVGDLRWRAPRPVAPWQGVRAANRLGHNCVQHEPYGDIHAEDAGMSEDCLYLNVWTQAMSGRRPVMVWIHGGGFFAGFGGEERHNGAILTKKGAVVVTINYRLGAFGFLAHPALAMESPNHAAGNYGILDQIAALKWVQRNIAQFGGDPSRVTIFGESAGAMSVGTLLASPLAKGLFHRAILESGTGTTLIQTRADAAATAEKIATALGVPGTDAAAAPRLRAVPAETLLAVAVRSAPNKSAPILWPSVDGYVLPRPVDATIMAGTANVVPIIVGSNKDEPQDVFGAPARSLARLMTARGGTVFMYQFTRVAEEDSAAKARGAYHSADIVFAFGREKPISPVAGRASYDARLGRAMSDYWVAFATSGDPNGPPSAGRWPRWTAYDAATESYMDLGREIASRSHLNRAMFDSLDVVGRKEGQVRP